jgi:hypothetical protein
VVVVVVVVQLRGGEGVQLQRAKVVMDSGGCFGTSYYRRKIKDTVVTFKHREYFYGRQFS